MLRYLLEKKFEQIHQGRFMPKIIFIIPIMQLIILPFAANFEMRNINLSIADNDHPITSIQLVDKVLSSGYFRLTDRSDRYDEALTSVESNGSDIILEIPSDFERDLGKGGRTDMMIAANAVNGTKDGLGNSYLSPVIQDFNRGKGLASMGSGRGMASINLFNPHLSYKIYMAPGVMISLLMIIGRSISALNIVNGKEKGAIEQINVSPAPKSLFLLSKLVPLWVMGFVLLMVAIFIVWLIYGLVPKGSFGMIYLFATVYLIALTGFGLAISSFSSTQQQTMLTAFFFLIIFVLLSGLFTPINSMSEWAQRITLANPMCYFVEVMRVVYLKGSGFTNLRGHFVIVCLFAVFFNLLAVISYRKKGQFKDRCFLCIPFTDYKLTQRENMSFIIVVFCLALLIVLISYFKMDAFIAFLISSILVGIALNIPLEKLPDSADNGIGSILGGLMLIIVLGTVLGKLVAESGAAQETTSMMVSLFGTRHIQWGLIVTGFAVGIPLFYGIGFVLLVPLIFSIVYKYKLPAVCIGLPTLAALSVAHEFLPPHPSPVALVVQFNASIGLTLIHDLFLAIPAIVIAGSVFGSRLKHVKSGPVTLLEQREDSGRYSVPDKANSFISATLPVFLLIIVTVIPCYFEDMGETASGIVSLIGAPSIVILIALLFATYMLGIWQGRNIKPVVAVCEEAVKDISMILLIIAGSGVFKQIMEDSGVSSELATGLEQLLVHPLILSWLISAVIRLCVRSAAVAVLTAADVVIPLVTQTSANPNLMALSLGAGSLMFSHVNDSGFQIFEEYFNLSIKDTICSQSIMETIVSVVRLIGVMILNMIIQ